MDDRDEIDRFLNELQTWGWERAAIVGKHAPPPTDPSGVIAQACAGWHAAERGDHITAQRLFLPLLHHDRLGGWAHLGMALVELRARHLDPMDDHLAHATEHAEHDPWLRATIHLVRGVRHFHAHAYDVALHDLEQAATLFGRQHFSFGRVLDALGMWYASQDYFQAAHLLFQQALAHKTQSDDQTGLALTHGQLGRLYLDWGEFSLARHHLEADLQLCQQLHDQRGAAQMHNQLGLVALYENDATDALRQIETSIALAQLGGWPLVEAFARKDRVLVKLLAQHLVPPADLGSLREDVDFAQRHFSTLGLREGMAHVFRAQSLLAVHQQHWGEAERSVQAARALFEELEMFPDTARVCLELAQLALSAGRPAAEVRQCFLEAVQAAERARRPHLVREADAALLAYEPGAAAWHTYRRVRGRALDHDTTSLTSAERQNVSPLFFDLQGFTAWSRDIDPHLVMLCLNEIMGTLQPSLRTYDLHMLGYTGDGFLALARGPRHAYRAVAAALEMYARLEPINRPRRILQLPSFHCRIGVHTGDVVLGNVGNYDMLFYSAVGSTVNLASRLQNEATLLGPCISMTTWHEVRDEFEFAADSPRTVDLKGIGSYQVWDVIACKRNPNVPSRTRPSS